MNTLQQQLPKRFTDAVGKLYNAFHENRLNAMDCQRCAVGNMCDGDFWNRNRYALRSTENIPKSVQKKTGYSFIELRNVELIFMIGVRLSDNLEKLNPEKRQASNQSKQTQFEGLCDVIQYLCELDNIPNIMDFTSLFETENDKPVRELQFA